MPPEFGASPSARPALPLALRPARAKARRLAPLSPRNAKETFRLVAGATRVCGRPVMSRGPAARATARLHPNDDGTSSRHRIVALLSLAVGPVALARTGRCARAKHMVVRNLKRDPQEDSAQRKRACKWHALEVEWWSDARRPRATRRPPFAPFHTSFCRCCICALRRARIDECIWLTRDSERSSVRPISFMVISS
jgi:hypothetical protein